jgi:hypothetical protein
MAIVSTGRLNKEPSVMSKVVAAVIFFILLSNRLGLIIWYPFTVLVAVAVYPSTAVFFAPHLVGVDVWFCGASEPDNGCPHGYNGSY